MGYSSFTASFILSVYLIMDKRLFLLTNKVVPCLIILCVKFLLSTEFKLLFMSKDSFLLRLLPVMPGLGVFPSRSEMREESA